MKQRKSNLNRSKLFVNCLKLIYLNFLSFEIFVMIKEKLTSRSSSFLFFRNSTKRSQTARTMFGGALLNASASARTLSISSSRSRNWRPEYGLRSSSVVLVGLILKINDKIKRWKRRETLKRTVHVAPTNVSKRLEAPLEHQQILVETVFRNYRLLSIVVFHCRHCWLRLRSNVSMLRVREF